jgi:tetratricopeptide (TPR) repeat protein
MADRSAALGGGAQGGARAPAAWPALWPLLAFAAFALLGLSIYRGALDGPFVSDDFGYVVSHPYTAQLDAASVRAIFDPFGPAKLYAANYAPIHLLLTALEKQIFADATTGYHLVNVLVHAGNATLLVLLFLASGVPVGAALLGGLLFAAHPANVEAVAWISQLKTSAALLFSLGALLAFRRRPGWATLLFVLGLLTKASAAFALPTAAAFTWAWGTTEPGRSARRWAWLGLWTALFAAYAVPQFASFAHQGQVEVEDFADRGVQLRTVGAVGARYLVMAASSWGVSAFQEPPPTRAWLDPWWLLALPAGLLLLARLVVCLRRRSVEAAWWVAAAASFAPVSQVFPFLNPVADRYLYFILPGLLGAGLCLWSGWSPRLPLPARRAAAAAALGLAVFFAFHAAERARLWRGETWLLLDAAAHYPEGSTAAFLRARRAAQEGDAQTAVAELRRATERGIDRFSVLTSDRALAPLHADPGFQELVREMAGRWIERARERGVDTQAELRMVALAHVQREEWDAAAAAYEQALAAGGPLEATLREELAAVRRVGAQAAAGPEDGGDAPRP